jgi:stearoyl-CoA desaturase (delta-9 desaturase)
MPEQSSHGQTTRDHKSSVKRILTSAIRWFDNAPAQIASAEENGSRLQWFRTLPLWGVHLMCFGIIWVGWSPVAVVAAVTLYLIRMFAITGFYHRYFSHRTFKTSRWFQFVSAAIANSAAQKGPLWWAAHHRHHHLHSDDDEDTHSPVRRGFLWSHMGWIFTARNAVTNIRLVPDLAKFSELRFLDRFDILIPTLLGVFTYFLGVYLENVAPELGTSGMQMLVWGFLVSTVAVFHSTSSINSLAHLFGRRRYETKDHSRNNFLLALITLGEGWHNNHHHYSTATRQGFFWWELDLTYIGLLILSKLGLVWGLKPVPDHVLNPQPTGSS